MKWPDFFSILRSNIKSALFGAERVACSFTNSKTCQMHELRESRNKLTHEINKREGGREKLKRGETDTKLPESKRDVLYFQ